MAPAHSSTHQDSAAHLRGHAGGPPSIQIVLDLESDLTSIRSAAAEGRDPGRNRDRWRPRHAVGSAGRPPGIDGAAVPRLLPRPARALTGETA
jgi:hypothetical protein